MTDQDTIPAEKVRELKTKYEYDTSGDPERLLDHLLHDLDDLLPTLPQPTTGLLGRWAKHPEHGDVVCVWDRTDGTGHVFVRWVDEKAARATDVAYVPLDSLTFPHQATRPEDVPAGEAWLVDVEDSEESHKSIVALKYTWDDWRTSDGVTNCSFWEDTEVTLISPLTPERPVSDLQAKSTERALDRVKSKYDELNAKYREAQERIKTLEQSKPAWRIEHDHTNLRVGDYIIDIDGDDGTLTGEKTRHSNLKTDGEALGGKGYAPFIVFPNKDAATPEAIEEAKRARDKETGK